jgi:hypothetical protein
MARFDNLRRAIKSEFEQRQGENLKRFEVESVEALQRQYHKAYKGDAYAVKHKLLRAMNREPLKWFKRDLALVEAVEASEDFDEQRLTLSVEWKRSQMWGKNPRACTNYGFNGSSIGGCGYDKLSTATAEALNSFLPLLKRLYVEKDAHINIPNRELLGYGSGHGLLPAFEGGVGVECHQRICEALGLSMSHIVNTPNADVFIIEKKRVC